MQKEYQKRREVFIEQLPTNSLTLLFAGCEVKKSADEMFPFQVDNSFFYLTGINQENSVLLIMKGHVEVSVYLFIDEFDALVEIWTGTRLKVAEVKEISGIVNVLFTKNFKDKLAFVLKEFDTSNKIRLCYDSSSVALSERNLDTEGFKNKMLNTFNHLEAVDISKTIISMRMIKSEVEIAQIKSAINMTKTALTCAVKAIKPGNNEYHVAAKFAYCLMKNNYAKTAFNTIAASGANATILHYPHPLKELKTGELILLDLGADYKGYKSDISRTYPVSGKFSEIQRKIYRMVLDCNVATINHIRPGVTLGELQTFACEYLAAQLINAGMITHLDELKKYYYHNVSHHLGLDTHDLTNRELPLKAGMVITVEPGLYFKEYGIGIRIEDDILVTENGSECLSKDIVKDIEGIEALMEKSKNEQ